jgi:hypothetical protein
VQEKPTVVSPFLEVFPSDRIPKATTDDRVHLFIHNFTFMDVLITDNALTVCKAVNYTSGFGEPFGTTICYAVICVLTLCSLVGDYHCYAETSISSYKYVCNCT